MKPEEPQPKVLPSWAHSLCAVGPQTRSVVVGYFDTQHQPDLFGAKDEEALKTVGAALGGWKDTEAAKVVSACIFAFTDGRRIDLPSLSGWILLHVNDSASVIDCMRVQPPEEIRILRRMA